MAVAAHILRFESQLDGVAVMDPQSSPVASIIAAIRAARWEEVHELAENILPQAACDDERAFVLYCAVATCEMQSNDKKREIWMQRWSVVENPESNAYCRYVLLFQNALTAFFSAYLNEAEFRFSKALEAARAAGFRNGEMRALFHLGLVGRDRFDAAAAWTNLAAALEIAQELGATRYEARIREQMCLLNPDYKEQAGIESLGGHILEIERALSAGDVTHARRALAQAELLRRKQRIGRKFATLPAFLAMTALLQKKTAFAERALRWISDPLLVVKVLEFKKSLGALSASESERLNSLYALHGLATAVRVHPTDIEQTEIYGRRLQQIEDVQVHDLFRAFLTSKNHSLSKEDLCLRVWQLPYDPVLHDGRIYKLIHKARQYFKGQDLFGNTYGGYRLKTMVTAS